MNGHFLCLKSVFRMTLVEPKLFASLFCNCFDIPKNETLPEYGDKMSGGNGTFKNLLSFQFKSNIDQNEWKNSTIR